MNHYIITHERFHMHGKEQDYTISALFNDSKKMTEVSVHPVGKENLLSGIYIGRVENVVKNLNAAFIRIAPDVVCYYSMEDYKHPLFTKKITEKKPLAEGEELVVQVSKEAIKTKMPSVTTNLNFTGMYAVLTTENTKIGISSKLPKQLKEHFGELLRDYPHPDFGLIIRTNAKNVTERALLDEIEGLRTQWETIRETAKAKTCYTCLKKAPSVYLKDLTDLPKETLAEIVTDDRTIFEELCEYYGLKKECLTSKGAVRVPVDEVVINSENGLRENDTLAYRLTLRYYHDPLLTLASCYSIRTHLENALKERVWLKSGAYLVIQPTEALTVIDVNSGKNIAKKDIQENFLQINLEAAEEIANQLRLRNISGIIIVDFINLTSQEAQQFLLKEFRAALKRDPVQTDVVSITRLGLVEVTRKKKKKPLSESFKSEQYNSKGDT